MSLGEGNEMLLIEVVINFTKATIGNLYDIFENQSEARIK